METYSKETAKLSTSKSFYVEIRRNSGECPGYPYVVGDLTVTTIRPVTWLDRLVSRCLRLKPVTTLKHQAIQIPDTNATIGVKITSDHYAELVGMSSNPGYSAALSLVPAPLPHEVASAPTQDC